MTKKLSRRKIAILSEAFLYDGAPGVNGTLVQLFNIAEALSGQDFDVHYVAANRKGGHRVDNYAGICLHWMPSTASSLNWRGEIQEARRLLDDVAPDIVYQRGRSHLTWAAASWAAKRGKRFVWASNGEDSCDYWKKIRQISRSRRRLWRKLLLCIWFLPLDILIHRGIALADAVINQTAHQKQRLLVNYCKAGVILPSLFPPPSEVSFQVKEKLVLWLANPGPAKRPEFFLDLAEQLAGAHSWCFALGGNIPETPYGTALETRASELANVKVVGAIPFDDSQAWYARASLFVNTSLPEADGLPNAYIQAWYAGTPVLSLNHDPNGWIGIHGLGFCAGGDKHALVAKLRELMNDPETLAEMAARCRSFAEKTFCASDLLDRYIQVFTDDG